jgi:hypothetical protein
LVKQTQENIKQVPADKTFNNIVFVSKAHYHNSIVNEPDINPKFGYRCYTPTLLSKDEILQNNASCLTHFIPQSMKRIHVIIITVLVLNSQGP